MFWKIARLVSFLCSGRCQRGNVPAHYKDKGADVVRTVLIFVLQMYNLQLLDLKLIQIVHRLLKTQMVQQRGFTVFESFYIWKEKSILEIQNKYSLEDSNDVKVPSIVSPP